MRINDMNDNNFEQCLKCTICTVYCPVVPANPAYPGPKQAGPDGERLRLKNGSYYDKTLKYCLNCKRCEVACPSGVRVADIIQNARIRYGKQIPGPREIALASTDLVGRLATVMSGVVNPLLRTVPVKEILHSVVGVDKHRTFPSYAGETFEKWFRKNAAVSQGAFPEKISYFHGCYVNYNYPQLGKDFVKVMNALGIGVELLDDERCCSIAMVSNGLIKAATKNARHNVDIMEKAVETTGAPIVGASSTCIMTMRDEYPHLLGIDNSKVRDSLDLATKFIFKKISEGKKLNFRKDFHARIAYHTPCHLERLGWEYFSIELLKMIPGVELTVLESCCCGIAGTYGFKKENYEVSQAIGRPLFEQIAAVGPDFVACDCETCKWQIEMSTGVSVKHPVSVLAEAICD